jgi:membrane complex biogenesis BtpA family protein
MIHTSTEDSPMPPNPVLTGLRAGKLLIGMVHVGALPGTPANTQPIGALLAAARADATTYRDAGFDAVMVENMHDVPYVRDPGPEIVAAMTRACAEVRSLGLPTGVQVLAGANREALAIALAADLAFVRVEGFVYAHIADEGLIEACAGDLLRYRRQIGATGVAVFADIKKKHCAHAITADVDHAETARTAAFFGADGVIVTGTRTGVAPAADDLREVRAAVTLPVLVGSGVTADNLPDLLPDASALIVGSAAKVGGLWSNPVCPERAQRLASAFREAAGRR